MLDQKYILNKRNLIFFGFVTACAVIGAPLYVYHYGLSTVEIGLFLFFTAATGMSITIGYHRLFAHRAFEAHPILKYLVVFFGAGAFQESTLQWTSQHRNHHKYCDTDQDPYNIKQGFWYAHIGWLLWRKHNIDYSNVKDLEQSKLIVSQHKHFVEWAVVSGILLPTLIGGLFGHWLGGFLIGVAFRMTFVHHGTFMINSVCHYFGRASYDGIMSPRDHWLVALITYGEGYHSFHHRFPSDYRNGYKWFHFDPSKWTIRLLSCVGLTKNLKRASKFQILSANIIAERDCAQRSLARLSQHVQKPAFQALRDNYEGIKNLLHQWELRAKEHAEIRRQGLSKTSSLRQTAAKRVQEARIHFLKVQQQWSWIIEKPVLRLSFST
jgi:stearoyl-CoA desaturase (Delta-9 desaturase)